MVRVAALLQNNSITRFASRRPRLSLGILSAGVGAGVCYSYLCVQPVKAHSVMSVYKTEGGDDWSWFAKVNASKIPRNSTAEQACGNWDGKGKVALVTGGYSGIGLETCRVMAGRGCEVIMAGRSAAKGKEAVEAIKKEFPDASVRFAELDLASLKSVAEFAADFKKNGERLDVLLNNAGVMACPFTKSADGYELQFATNHLGHFLLTDMLLDMLKATGKKTGQKTRVITVSSSAHRLSKGINFDALDSSEGYTSFGRYGDSKLENILFTRALDERLKKQQAPVISVCLHPGVILTNLQRYLFPGAKFILGMFPSTKGIPQGAATQVFLATADDSELKGGEFYFDLAIQASTKYAHDRDAAEKLWEVSEKICKEFKQ